MGKPYDSDLHELDTTYRWARSVSVGRLTNAIRSAVSLPLVAVGSGGSFSTADFAAMVHRKCTGRLGSAVTPMEAVEPTLDLRAVGVLLATAGGRNPDVLHCFRTLVPREPRRFIVLCTSAGSPLARLAAKYASVDLIEMAMRSGKDGFLATNSLLASTVLLARAYAEVSGVAGILPEHLSDLLKTDWREGRIAEVHRHCEPLWERDTLVVLHGPSVRTAAIDLESKFTEAALGNVRVADYRHFAHGRHVWLAKRPTSSAILAFITPEDERIASKTLALVPNKIPILPVAIPSSGIAGSLAALVHVFHIVGSAGRARGIDPGRPSVPRFGRQIYHLRPTSDTARTASLVPSPEALAIERKTHKSVATLAGLGEIDRWRKAYAAFTKRLAKASFRAIVFDYDGTLCDEAHRYEGISTVVGHELARLLRLGALIGIATGRGKSVKEAIRERIPTKYWDRILVGYYNGGDVARLDDDSSPDGSDRVVDALKPVAEAIKDHPELSRLGTFEFRLPQIKSEPRTANCTDSLWRLLQQVVYGLSVPGVTVVSSTHSLDVLAPCVSKRAVLEKVVNLLGDREAEILCIGDRGQWPGNDFCLLSSPYALSVDEVSADPATCWNLAPAGARGVDGTLDYMRRITTADGRIRFKV